MPIRMLRIVRNGKKKHRGDDLRQDEVRGGVDAHDLQRVDLLGDAHGADLGGDGRSHLAGQNERHDRRGELQDHGFARGVADQVLRNEGRLQVDGHLQGDDRADEDRDDGCEADGVHAEGIGLVDDAAAVDGHLLRTGEDLAHQQEITTGLFEQFQHGSIFLLFGLLEIHIVAHVPAHPLFGGVGGAADLHLPSRSGV